MQEHVEVPMSEKLKSRKFIMAVLAHIVNLYMFATAQIDGSAAMSNVVYITAIYTCGEAFKDGGHAFGGAKLGDVLAMLVGNIQTPNGNDGSNPK